MTRLLIIFLILIGSVILGVQLSHDPGYLLISINRWSLETTLWVAIIALFIVFILMHSFLALLAKLGRGPRKFRHWQRKRRALKAKAQTRRGLIEFSEGYWSQAQTHLIKALPDSDSPLLNYLTAARAAQKMGDIQLRDNYLREAQQAMPDAKIAVELTQAQLQLANHQWEQALATLQHLKALAPRHPYVLKLLMQLYIEVKDWPQLIALLPDLKKNQIVSGQAYDKLQRQTYLAAITELAEQKQTEALTKMIRNLPKNLAKSPELMALYCRFLMNQKEDEQAEKILRESLRHYYDEKLVNLYGQIKAEESQLIFAESLLKKHPNSAELYLCLGRLSLHKHLWGKARSYLEKSISLTANSAAYEELGKLLEQLNDPIGACAAYRQGLELKSAHFV